jgi:hypothetical protein
MNCPHSRVEFKTKQLDRNTVKGWWACASCGQDFPNLGPLTAEEYNRQRQPCSWCNTIPIEAEKRHEGPHATWCVHYRTRGQL